MHLSHMVVVPFTCKRGRAAPNFSVQLTCLHFLALRTWETERRDNRYGCVHDRSLVA